MESWDSLLLPVKGYPALYKRLQRLVQAFIRYNSARQLAVSNTFQERQMAKARKASSAFMKAMQPSEELAQIVGNKPLPRTEVTKKIWAHIKRHKLQNPKNKREILADDKLQPIFGAKKLDMFQMTRAVNKHLK